MKIKELREAAGLSGADVARALGVNSAAVVRWENGKALPRCRQASGTGRSARLHHRRPVWT